MNLKDLTEFPILNETTIPNDLLFSFQPSKSKPNKNFKFQVSLQLSTCQRQYWLVDNTNFIFYSPTYAAQNILENGHFIVSFPRDWLCKKIYIYLSIQKASDRKTSIAKEVSTKTSCCHLSEYHSHAQFSVFNGDGWMMLFQYWCDWLDYWEEGRLAVFSETFPCVSAEFPPLLIPRLDLGVFLIIGRARLHFFCLQGQMKSNNNIYHMI